MQEVKKKVEAIDGLETLMSSLGLEDKLPDAANWCEVNGAESVRDIHEADCAEQLAKDLGLPLVKANKLIKAIKKLGTAGAHLDISAAEQAIKHESEILSILKDHKAKKEDDRDNPVELACDLSTQYFRARDDLFMCRMNVENAIFKSKGEESTEVLECAGGYLGASLRFDEFRCADQCCG